MLEPELVRRLERYRLGGKDTATSLRRGPHASRRTGRGMVFADYRDYREGDDLQTVDWRALARLDRLVVRLALEERERPLYLLVDASASMRFGSPAKWQAASRCAAALAHVALADLDRVTLFASSSGLREFGPLRGRQLTHEVIGFLAAIAPDGPTDLAAALRVVLSRPRGTGLFVLISDFLDPAGAEPALGLLAGRGHDVVVMHVLSGADRDVPDAGELTLVDAESGETFAQSLSPAVAAAYREAFDAFAGDVEAACARQGCRHLRVDADDAQADAWLRDLVRLRVLV